MNSDLVRARQQWVKDHPARTVEELTLPGYAHDVETRGGLIIRTVLSIDLFVSPLAWRCQIALMRPSRLPRPRSEWSLEENVFALQIARQLLAGVGDLSRSRLTTDSVSFELAYPLLADEAEYALRAAMRPATAFEAPAIGEISAYDFTDRATQVDGWWNGKLGREEGLFLPKQRTILHARQRDN